MADLEKPTITEPEGEPKLEGKEAKAPEIDIKSLVEELEKAGVTNTQELQGKLRASQEVGQMANLLGDANKRIENLEKAARMPPAEPELDYSEETPIDIESIVEKKLTSVLDAREAKTRQVQQQAMQIWQDIQTDPDYGLVKEVWEAKIKDPNFNMAIQSGKKDVSREYMETVRGYYKGVSQRSLDTIKALQGGVAPAAPHVEGEAQLPGIPTKTTPEQETVTIAKEKVAKGGRLTEDEELAALNAILRSSESEDL